MRQSIFTLSVSTVRRGLLEITDPITKWTRAQDNIRIYGFSEMTIKARRSRPLLVGGLFRSCERNEILHVSLWLQRPLPPRRDPRSTPIRV
jgi:hypothetical protein